MNNDQQKSKKPRTAFDDVPGVTTTGNAPLSIKTAPSTAYDDLPGITTRVEPKPAEQPYKLSPFENDSTKKQQHDDWVRYSKAAKDATVPEPKAGIRTSLARNGIVDLRQQEKTFNSVTQKLTEYAKTKNISLYDEKNIVQALQDQGVQLGQLEEPDLYDLAEMVNKRRMAEGALDRMRTEYGVNDNITKARRQKAQEDKQRSDSNKTWAQNLYAPTPKKPLGPQGVPESNDDMHGGTGNYQFSAKQLRRTPEFRVQQRDDAFANKRPEFVAAPYQFDAVKNNPDGTNQTAKQTSSVMIPSSMLGDSKAIAEITNKEREAAEIISPFMPLTELPVKPESVRDDATGQERFTGNMQIGDINQAYRQLDNEFLSKFTSALLTDKYLTGDNKISDEAAKSLAFELLKYTKSQSIDDGVIDVIEQAGSIGSFRPLVSWTGQVDDYVTSRVKSPNVLRIYNAFKEKYQQLEQVNGIKRFYGDKIPKDLFANNNEAVALRSSVSGFTGFHRGFVGWLSKSFERSMDIAEAENEAARIGVTPPKPKQEELHQADLQEQLWQLITAPFTGTTDPTYEAIFNSTNPASLPNVSQLRQLLPQIIANNEAAKVHGDPAVAAKVQEFVGSDTFIEQVVPAVGQLIGSIRGGGFKIASSTVSKASSFIRTSSVGQKIAASKYMQQLGTTLHTMNPQLIPNARAASEMAAVMSMSHLIETFPTANLEELEQSAISGALFPIVGNLIANRVFMPLVSKYKSVQGVLENEATQQAFRTSLISNHGPEKGAELFYRALNAARVQKDLAFTLGNVFGNPAQGVTVATLTGQEYDWVSFVLDAVMGAGASGHLRKTLREYNRPLTTRDLESFIEAREAEEHIADTERAAKQYQGETSIKAEDAGENIVEEKINNAETPVPDQAETAVAQETGNVVNPVDPINVEELEQQYVKEYDEQIRKNLHNDDAVLETPVTPPAEPIKLSQMTSQESFSDGMSNLQLEALQLIHRNASDTPVVYHDGRSYYDKANDTIFIGNDIKGTAAERNALIHEGVHAATVKLLAADPALRDDVLRLQSKIVSSSVFQKWMANADNWEKALYMQKSPYEFITGVIDNVHGVADVIENEAQGFGRETIDTIKKAFNKDAMTTTDVYGAIQDMLRTFPTMEVVQTADTQPLNNVSDAIAQALGEAPEVNADMFDQITKGLSIDFIADDYETFVDPDSNLGLFKDLAKKINLVGEETDRQGARANTLRFIDNLRRYGIEDEVGYEHIMETMMGDHPNWEDYTPYKKSEILLENSGKIVANNELVQLLKAKTQERVDSSSDKPLNEIVRQPTVSLDELSTVLGSKSVHRLKHWINKNFHRTDYVFDTINQKIDQRIEELFGPIDPDESGRLQDGEREATKVSFREKALATVRGHILQNHNMIPVMPLEIAVDVNNNAYISSINSKNRVSPVSGRKLVTEVQNPTSMIRRLGNIREGLLQSSAKKPYPFFEKQGIMSVLDALTNLKFGVVTDSKMLEEQGHITDSGSLAKIFLNHANPGWFFMPGTAEGNLFADLRALFPNKRPSKESIKLLTKQIETLNLVDFLDSEQTWRKPNGNKFVPRVLGAFDLWTLVNKARNNEYFDEVDAKASILEGLASNIYNAKSTANPVVNAKWFDAAMADAPTLAKQANEVISKLAEFYQPNSIGKRPEIRHKEDKYDEALISVLTEFFHKVTDYGNENTFATRPDSDVPIKNTNKYRNVAVESSYQHIKDVATLETLLSSQGKLSAPLDLNKVEPANRDLVKSAWRQRGIIIGDDGTVKMKQFIMTNAWAEANPDIWMALSGQVPGENTGAKLIPPSKFYDGGTFIINKAAHDFLAEAFNRPADRTGGIKLGYGGDWIWKSALSEQYDVDNPIVDKFFEQLRDRGVSMIAMQSAFKSRGKNFSREDVPSVTPGRPTRYVYDHNGTLLGIEDETGVKSLTPEDLLALHSNGNVDIPGAYREYDIVGPNAVGFSHVASAPDESSFNKGISLSIDRSPYVYGESGQVLKDIINKVHSNVAARFAKVVRGDQMLLATAPLSSDMVYRKLTNLAEDSEVFKQSVDNLKRVYNHDTGIVADRDLYNHVKMMLSKAQQSEPGGDLFATPDIKRAVIRGLNNALLDNNLVAIRNLHTLDAIYGNVIHGPNTLRKRVMDQEFDSSRKAKTLGKMFRLNMYVPAQNHVEDGRDISTMWTRIAAEEEAQRLELTTDEAINFIDAKVAEHQAYLDNDLFPTYLPNGKLAAYDQSVIMSVNDIDAYNRHVQKERANGKDIPYLTLGSKFITKLNPPDGLDSYSARVLVGADSRKNHGIMVNHEFLTQEISRDFDGDDFGIFFENPDWNGRFLDMWDELTKQGSHLGDPAKKIEITKNLRGVPFPKKAIDQRQQTMDNFNKTQEANRVGKDKIDEGISNLSAWYEAYGGMQEVFEQTGKQSIATSLLGINIDFTIGGNIDLWKSADAFTKTAQYDTWNGLPFDPRDVFFGTRVADVNITYVPEYRKESMVAKRLPELRNAIEEYKATGTVYPLLMEQFVRAYRAFIPGKSKDSVVAKIPRYSGFRSDEQLHKFNDSVYGGAISQTVKQFEQGIRGVDEKLLSEVQGAVYSEIDPTPSIMSTQRYDAEDAAGNSLYNPVLYNTLQLYQNTSYNLTRNLAETMQTLQALADIKLGPSKTMNEADFLGLSNWEEMFNVFGNMSALDARFDLVSNLVNKTEGENFTPSARIYNPNNIFNNTASNPDALPPVQLALAEMLQRAYGQIETTIPIAGNPDVAWEVTKDGVTLVTPDQQFGIEEIYRKGEYTEPITELMAKYQITPNDLFPPNLIMPAVIDRATVKKAMIPSKITEVATSNPDTVFIATKMDGPNITDGWSENYTAPDNVRLINRFGLSDDGVIKNIQQAIVAANKDGKRPVLLNWRATDVEATLMPKALPSNLLDTGAAVRIDRNVSDRDRMIMLGRMVAIQESTIPNGIYGAMYDHLNNVGVNRRHALDQHYYSGLRDIYEGVKKEGGTVTMPNGQDILQTLYQDTVYYNEVKQLNNLRPDQSIDEIPGQIFGLFDGTKRKVEGFKLQSQRAGRLNRLNKYVGQRLVDLSWENTQEINDTISEYLKSEFGEGVNADEMYEVLMSAIDPQQLRTIEEGLHRKYSGLTQIEPNGKTRGENIIRANKSFYLAQALSDVVKITDKQAKIMGFIPRTWWDRYQVLANQDAPSFIRHYARDKKNHSLYTPISENIAVVVDEAGNVSQTITKNTLGSQYTQQMMPKYASIESETYVRHGYRKRYINGIKDKMAADLSELRGNLKERFEPIPNAGVVEEARRLVDMSLASVSATSVFNGINDPAITVKVGNKVFTADSNGYIADNELTAIAEEIYVNAPDYKLPTQYTRQNIINALKVAVTAKAQNHRYATYQHNIAASLEEYVRNLYEENTPNEIVPLSEEEVAAGITPVSAKPPIESTEFAQLWNQAQTIANDLRNEANARIKAQLTDNVNAMQFVNYDTFSEVITKALSLRDAIVEDMRSPDNETREQAKASLNSLYESYSQYFEVLGLNERYPELLREDSKVDQGKMVVSHMQSRRNAADRKNKQLSKVNSFFKREILGQEPERPAMFDDRDYKIMKFVFGQPDSFSEDLLFQRNKDVLQSTFLNINALFTNAYNTERNIRRALGKSVLDSPIAENNLLSLFSTDGTIYTENLDVHSSRGWRAKIAEVANEGRKWLSSDEMGVPLTTPVSVTYVADSNNNVKTITGRMAGVVRISPRTVASKSVQEAQQRLTESAILYNKMLSEGSITPEMFQSHMKSLEQITQKLGVDQKAEPKDVMVIYNQENGSLSYIDLETVSQVQKGQSNGWLANMANEARQKSIYKIFGEESELGEFLSGVEAQAMQKFSNNQVRQAYVIDDPKASINFFAKVGRKDMPRSLASYLDKTAQVISMGASQWRYGYGKETATILGSVLAAPFIGVSAAATGVAFTILAAGFKYGRNVYGNKLGYATRAAQVFPQLFNSEAMPGTFGGNIKAVGKNFVEQVAGIFRLMKTKEIDAYMREGTPAASTAKQRLEKGSGLAAELISPTEIQSTNRSTIMYVEMLNEATKVKQIIDGLGRFLTADDMDYIQQVINKNMRYAENVKASIRQGQLNLAFTKTNKEGLEQYVATLDELQAMNLNRLNQVLALSGKTLSFMDPILVATSRGLMTANNLRLRVFTNQGETEQEGILRSGSTSTKAFEALNVGRDVRTNPTAITSFVEQGIETLQGKFDEKAFHVQTPFGRAYNLFSQYFRRFAQRTVLDPINELQFWNSWYETVKEDKDFANVMMTKYGLDLGDQVAQRTFTAWSPDDGAQALRLSVAGKMAFIPLAVMGVASILHHLMDAFTQQSDYTLTGQVETAVEMIGGGEQPIGNAVKTIFEATSLFATADLEDAKTAQKMEYILRDMANIIPGGAGLKPAFDAAGLMGLYAMHQAGILPNMPNDMRWGKRVTDLLGPAAIPLQAPGDVIYGITSASRKMKREREFIANLVGEELEKKPTKRRRKPTRKKRDADSE